MNRIDIVVSCDCDSQVDSSDCYPQLKVGSSMLCQDQELVVYPTIYTFHTLRNPLAHCKTFRVGGQILLLRNRHEQVVTGRTLYF